MADQENCTRVTRLMAKKRAAEEATAADQNKKQRVVLGEIQNVLSSQNVGLRSVTRTLEIKDSRRGCIAYHISHLFTLFIQG
ncbi:cyclin [Castilleja foliolosa]|uniref:Cyclin n=1 Tax=Castilleja foliolosa TaxID=1961234 RepID=A0ABD3CX41_9LAMI